MSTDHLLQMKRRLRMTQPTSVSSGQVPAAEKVEMLEKTLNVFRAEVDMKLKIIQQILNTRNEQGTVQKRLLDREQTLYNVLFSHWLNAPDLAASGVSMNFSAENLDTGASDFDFSVDNFDAGASPDYCGGTSTTGEPVTKKPRRRHRKISKLNKDEPQTKTQGEVEDDPLVPINVEVDPLNVHDTSYDHKDKEWVPTGSGAVVPIKGSGYEGSHQDQRMDYGPKLDPTCTLDVGNMESDSDSSTSSSPSKPTGSKYIVMKRQRSIGRGKDSVWNYFSLVDKKPGQRRPIVTCNACHQTVSGEASRLKTHRTKCKGISVDNFHGLN